MGRPLVVRSKFNLGHFQEDNIVTRTRTYTLPTLLYTIAKEIFSILLKGNFIIIRQLMYKHIGYAELHGKLKNVERNSISRRTLLLGEETFHDKT